MATFAPTDSNFAIVVLTREPLNGAAPDIKNRKVLRLNWLVARDVPSVQSYSNFCQMLTGMMNESEADRWHNK